MNLDKKYPEFAVKNVFNLFKNDEEFMKYMPGLEMNLGRFPDRAWFWTMAYTLREEWTSSFME